MGARADDARCTASPGAAAQRAAGAARAPGARAGGALTPTYESSSPAETEAIAARLAAGLNVGDVVTVSGELGAGKTTFVRGAARALGVSALVTSPTYTIGNRYAGRVPVSHLDLYRFERVDPSEWGDLEPYFDGAVVFIEWPEAGAGLFPAARFIVELRHAGPERRLVLIDGAVEAL